MNTRDEWGRLPRVMALDDCPLDRAAPRRLPKHEMVGYIGLNMRGVPRMEDRCLQILCHQPKDPAPMMPRRHTCFGLSFEPRQLVDWVSCCYGLPKKGRRNKRTEELSGQRPSEGARRQRRRGRAANHELAVTEHAHRNTGEVHDLDQCTTL